MRLSDPSPDERRRRGTELCKRLAAEVATLTPPGIGAWPRAWEIVAPADAAFLIAVVAWESDPGERAKGKLRERHVAVLDAWRRAGAEFLAERTERRP